MKLPGGPPKRGKNHPTSDSNPQPEVTIRTGSQDELDRQDYPDSPILMKRMEIKQEIKGLQESIEEKMTQLRQLQKDCPHTHKVANGFAVVVPKYYCPECGLSDFSPFPFTGE